MSSEAYGPSSGRAGIKVLLDGLPVKLPPERRSLTAIHSFLEALALERQRILCSFSVDGQRTNPGQPLAATGAFASIAAETIEFAEIPLRLIKTALEQTGQARARVHVAVVLVLINDGCVAREFWWDLVRTLKEPLLTLSLVPDAAPVNGVASPAQLRNWQLQQLAAIIKQVDEACWAEGTAALSNALEQRVLPWLDSLQRSLELRQELLLH